MSQEQMPPNESQPMTSRPVLKYHPAIEIPDDEVAHEPDDVPICSRCGEPNPDLICRRCGHRHCPSCGD